MTNNPTFAADDQRSLGWPDIRLTALLFAALVADGFDLQNLAFAAPSIARSMAISPGGLGPVFSAGLAGVFIGAPLFGWLGDRYGRRFALIVGCLICGIFSIATSFAPSLEVIGILRFITGLGIGGVLPNAIALSAEMAPKRLRGQLTVLMIIGLTAGGALPGLLVSRLDPIEGWHILFMAGGVVPILASVLLYAFLPESQVFKERHLADDQQRPAFSFAGLFKGPLAQITPLLWLMFVAVLLSIHLLNSWLPLALEAHGLPPESAALYTSSFHMGGSIGGLAMSFLIDRFKLRSLMGYFLLAGFILLSVGTLELPDFILPISLALVGFCVVGVQFGLNVAAGLIYPVEVRSTGVGCAIALGRLSSISGPLIGAVLIGGSRSFEHILLVPLIPLSVGLVATLVLSRLSTVEWLKEAA
jgi:AAHS family 4-hydroxybenzoate transporter-like MFS transporter